MRKKTAILGMFCLLCSLAASAAPVSAAEEIEEIARLEADIREFADSCAGGWTEISVIGTGEVDFSRAYRICVDVDLFEEESLSREDYLMLEAEAPAVWVIPVYYEERHLSGGGEQRLALE